MGISTFGGSAAAGTTSPFVIGQVIQAVGGPGLIQANGQIITQAAYPTLFGYLAAVRTPSTTTMTATGVTTATAMPTAGTWFPVFLASANLYISVVTGTSGTSAATSSDGKTWTSMPLPVSQVWTTVAASPTVVVAAGANGNIAYTTNGTSWNLVTLPNVPGTAATVIWTGTQFVFCDPTAQATYTSPDGVTWTGKFIPSIGSKVGATKVYKIGSTKYIAPGISKYALSQDGLTWTSYTLPGVGTTTTCAVAYNGSTILFGGANGIYSSTDGITWNALATPPYVSATSVCVYAIGTSFLVTTATGSYFSTDGVNWIASNLTAVATNKFASNGTIGVTITGNTAGLLNTATGQFSFQTLGTTASNTWLTPVWDGSQFVILQSGGTARLTSADGVTWAVSTTPTSFAIDPVVFGTTIMACIASSNTIYFSNTHGASWTTLTLPYAETNSLIMPASINNKGVVVIGVSGSTSGAATVTTSNGTSWYSAPAMFVSGALSQKYSAFNPTTNATVVLNPITVAQVMYSPDGGNNWSNKNIGNTVSGVCYSQSIGLFFAFSNGGPTLTSTGYVSSDGVTWSSRTIGSSYYGLPIAVGNMVVCVNNYATAQTSQGAIYSFDGTTWNSLSGLTGYISNVAVNTNSTMQYVANLATSSQQSTIVTKTYDERSAIPVPTYTPSAGNPPWFIKAL